MHTSIVNGCGSIGRNENLSTQLIQIIITVLVIVINIIVTIILLINAKFCSSLYKGRTHTKQVYIHIEKSYWQTEETTCTNVYLLCFREI